MIFDKRQLTLKGELEERKNYYWDLKFKTFSQINFAPKSVKPLMFELVNYLEKTAIPIVTDLLDTIGFWKKDAAVEFYNANSEVIRISNLINQAASDEGRATWKTKNFPI